jgi:hypothetical protein
MKNAIFGFTLVVFAVFNGHCQKSSGNPAIVYESHGVLHLMTASGQSLQTVNTNHKIGSFAVSRDAREILFTDLPRDPDGYGGQLYLIRRPGKPKLLTHGPYYNKRSAPPEVYSDPDFAPDGTEAVFSIHSQSQGDLMEASGPFATVEVTTGKVTILPATLHVPGEAWGTGFASSAYWSPNGQSILLNFEDGFSLTDRKGKRFEDLPNVIEGSDWRSSLGWFGSQCIVFITGKDYVDARKQPARYLNLKTHETGLLNTLLGLNADQVTNLVAISGKIRVRRAKIGVLVEFGNSQWSIPNADDRTEVRILPRPSSEFPETCR